jgi:hypothetical protein
MRPRIKIGTTYPHFWDGRFVNAEVVSGVKIRNRFVWTVRLTESQQPLTWGSKCGDLAGEVVEFHWPTGPIANAIERIEALPTFGPARLGSCVVRWIDFGHQGRWCEVREFVVCGPSRPTHWDKCEYKTVEELVASGDANPVGAAT